MSTKKREKINQHTKLLDLKVTPGTQDGQGGVFFTFDNKRYFADRWTDHEPLSCVRWQDGMYVTDAKRDFGGCGKDAVKLEVGIPFSGWISDAFIREASLLADPVVVSVEPKRPIEDHRPPSIKD